MGRRLRKRVLQLLVVLVLAFVVHRFAYTFPPAPPHARVVPKLDALPKISVCWVECARQETSGQAGTAGLSSTKPWSVTVSAILVRHPRGDVLIDAANSSHFFEELRDYGFFSHLALSAGPGSNLPVATTPAALRAMGGDPSNLKWVILSHAHIDHAGGLVDLPGAPVLLPQEEIDFIHRFGSAPNLNVVPAHAKAMEGRMTAAPFTPVPYETFDAHVDVFGDGTIVLVKLPGHTPGSVGTFVNVSPTRRLLHVGDTVNVTEGYERRVGKSLVMAGSDFDSSLVGEQVAKLAQLHELEPTLRILPAHDRSAWKGFFGDIPTCVGP